MEIIEFIFNLAKKIGPEIVEALNSDLDQEEIEKRVTKQIRILKPEIDALRKRKDSINDFIKKG